MTYCIIYSTLITRKNYIKIFKDFQKKKRTKKLFLYKINK